MMRFLPLLILLAMASGAIADVIVLKDGTRYEGIVKRDGKEWHITTADGKVVTVSIDSVKSIELTGSNGVPSTSGAPGATTKSSPDQASSNLASLRRSVENVADI